MKYLALLLLVGCAKHPVIVWGGSSIGEESRIVIDTGGHANYTSESEGIRDKDEPLAFTKGQLAELHELFRSHHACELAHNPSYTPVENEGQTTVQLSFDDMNCTVTMYDLEWQRGPAREIAETMESMRPLRGQHHHDRKLNARDAAGAAR